MTLSDLRDHSFNHPKPSQMHFLIVLQQVTRHEKLERRAVPLRHLSPGFWANRSPYAT